MAILTVDDALRLVAAGAIPEDATHELLNGQIVRKIRGDGGADPYAHGLKHIAAIERLTDLLFRVEAANRFAQVQLPIICGNIEAPEPDFAMLRGAERDYSERLPGAQDTLVVIEAAGSSLERDQNEKLTIYAAASIPQYVILNLRNSTIEQYTDLDPQSGTYRTRATFTRQDTLALNGGSDGPIEIRAEELLP